MLCQRVAAKIHREISPHRMYMVDISLRVVVLNEDSTIKELYCSELIYVSYENNLIEANLEDFVGLGRDYISPVGLYYAINLNVVIDIDLL